MKTNMGTTDRIARVIIASLLLTFYLTGILTGTLGIILVVLAIVFVLTSVIGFCPLYTLIGVKTCKN